MFIDVHAHAYRKPTPFVAAFPTIEQVIARYDAVGIEKGMLLPVVNPEIYLPQSNEDILEMAQQYPDRIIPFCNIDPRALTNSVDAPLDRLLRYYKDQGCKGVGEIMPNLPFMHPMVQNLFKHAQAVGLPVTFDGSDQPTGDFGLYDDPGLPQLEHTLQRFPDLVIMGRLDVLVRNRAPGHARAEEDDLPAGRRAGGVPTARWADQGGGRDAPTHAPIPQALRRTVRCERGAGTRPGVRAQIPGGVPGPHPVRHGLLQREHAVPKHGTPPEMAQLEKDQRVGVQEDCP